LVASPTGQTLTSLSPIFHRAARPLALWRRFAGPTAATFSQEGADPGKLCDWGTKASASSKVASVMLTVSTPSSIAQMALPQRRQKPRRVASEER